MNLSEAADDEEQHSLLLSHHPPEESDERLEDVNLSVERNSTESIPNQQNNGVDASIQPTIDNSSGNYLSRESFSQHSQFSYEQNIKYFSPSAAAFNYYPGIGNTAILEDGDENEDLVQSLHHRKSSFFLNRMVSYAITVALLGSFIAVIILYVIHSRSQPGNDDSPENTCYLSPSCPDTFTSPQYNEETGFTNFTGWRYSGESSEQQCCNICPSSARHFPRLVQDASRKRNDAYASTDSLLHTEVNFDYLVFDQIWLPQFCFALELGHDPTLSHLSSNRCPASIYSSYDPQLVIHGLWPNRISDSLICCVSEGQTSVSTLNIANLQTWSFYDELQRIWFDPTITTSYYDQSTQTDIACSSCYLLNHEWQKHGSCFGLDLLAEDSQEEYFQSGLILAQVLASETAQVNSLVGQTVTKEAIEAIYAPVSVNVMCDPQDPGEGAGVLLEIQTCWDLVTPGPPSPQRHRNHPRTGRNSVLASNFTRIDCPTVRNSNYSSECPGQILIRDFMTSNLAVERSIFDLFV